MADVDVTIMGRSEQLQEALELRPTQMQRSGLHPAEARVCVTIVEANGEDVHRHVEEVWAVVDGGWLHAYDVEAQHWYSWPREAVHWIEWATPGRTANC